MEKLFLGNSTGRIINRNIYGHFSEHLGRCIYDGIFVGENSPIPNIKGIRCDIAEALRNIKIPVLRWPGGCFADEYHWRDGIGAVSSRKKMINTHWGGVTEDNSFGTHEFFELVNQLGCEPYICGNVGSGTVREMQDWVEYITFDGGSPMSDERKANGAEKPWRLKYFGVGNENWGCGGNMTPEYYADQYRKYSTYIRNFGSNRIYKIACGPNAEDYNWTEVLMSRVHRTIDGLSMHYYTIPTSNWGRKGSATNFSDAEYFHTMKNTLEVREIIAKHSEIMDKYDPNRRIDLIVDEWGIWTDVEPGTNPGFLYQQNSMRDALIAAVNFDIFNAAPRVAMANIAQTVNVLQAVILTEGAQMLLTPTYYAFLMYALHHDANLLDTDMTIPMYRCADADAEVPAVSRTVSEKDGNIYMTISNIDPINAFDYEISAAADIKFAQAQILTAEKVTSHNTFESPASVKIVDYSGISLDGGKIRLNLPSKSIISVKVTT